MSYVIGKIFSGLGNQLFQYAAAQGLASKTGRKLLICNSAHPDVKRPYGLDALIPAEQLLSDPRNRRMQWWVESRSASLLRKGAKLLALPSRVVCFTDDGTEFHSQIESQTGNIVLYGYWQNERYFAHIRESITDRIQSAFQIEPPVNHGESVCVHVRRGDYLQNSYLAPAPMAYFEGAMQYLRSTLRAPKFTLFSDDPEWCRQQFGTFDDVDIFSTSGKPQDQMQDFRRMAASAHFIISNSSFSWWAAYLGRNPDKIVVAPAQWWRNAGSSSPDPALGGWVRL
jgi:hypothetical protein